MTTDTYAASLTRLVVLNSERGIHFDEAALAQEKFGNHAFAKMLRNLALCYRNVADAVRAVQYEVEVQDSLLRTHAGERSVQDQADIVERVQTRNGFGDETRDRLIKVAVGTGGFDILDTRRPYPSAAEQNEALREQLAEDAAVLAQHEGAAHVCPHGYVDGAATRCGICFGPTLTGA